MRQPLMTARVGHTRGCNPLIRVVFFGAYLCSDQLHASRDWISESNQMVGEAGSRTGAFSSQARRATLIPFPVVKLKIHYAIHYQNQLNL